MRHAMLTAVLAAALPFAVWAGDQYVDQTGYAVSGYDVVAYRDLPQVPVGARQPQAVPGRADLTATYNGATFAFASAANRAKFVAAPATYAPQYDGHCAYGVAQGAKVPGNPEVWRIVDGKLYLNITRKVGRTWEKAIPANLTLARTNWSAINAGPASHDPVPQFSSAAPLTE